MTSLLQRGLAALALLVGTAVAATVTAVPASAAGVGGVEVTPSHGTAFHVSVPRNASTTERFTVRNIGGKPATVRLYAAAAATSDGTWTVDGPGSAPWLHVEARELTLQPNESRRLTFRVDGSKGARHGAIVLEQGAGTVVQRAATLIYTEPKPAVPLPLLIVVVAALLVAGGAAGFVTVARRKRADAEPVTPQPELQPV